MKTLLYTFSIFLLTYQTAVAQDLNLGSNIIPPTPESAALYRHIQVPVGHYTGTPQIEVPLLSVSEGDLQVPVSLSYHAAGNRVTDIATFVGLAWRLQAGGTVSRVVRGLPDDKQPDLGFLSFAKRFSYEDLFSSDPNQWVTLIRLAEGCADSEPDEFFFNFNGISGTFAFDWNGNLIVSTSAKVSIEPIFQDQNDENTESSSTGLIVGWTIIDGDGTIYKFLEVDYTTVITFPEDINLTSGCAQYINDPFASSWYLSEIIDVNQQHSIRFTYERYPLTQSFEPSEVMIHALASNSDKCGGSIIGTNGTSVTSLQYDGKSMFKNFL